VLDDFTPASHPAAAKHDSARRHWLEHPLLDAIEIRLSPTLATIVGYVSVTETTIEHRVRGASVRRDDAKWAVPIEPPGRNGRRGTACETGLIIGQSFGNRRPAHTSESARRTSGSAQECRRAERRCGARQRPGDRISGSLGACWLRGIRSPFAPVRRQRLGQLL
jgi:hypothetical protein